MAVTMRDVAREAGVSSATVSYVLSDRQDMAISQSTRAAVLQAARRLNYRYNVLAAHLRRGATHMVGIQLYSLAVPVLARKVAALERVLRAAGYYPFLCHALDGEAQRMLFELCANRQLCGLVLTDPPQPDSRPDLERLLAEGIPVVSVEPIPDLPIPYVTVDRGGGAELAVRHLRALGHERIAAVVGFTGNSAPEFRAGYLRGFANAPRLIDPALIIDLEPAKSNYERGARAVERLLALPETPTAILMTDDDVAIGALRSLLGRGLRVPADVALIGCDDNPAAAHAEVPLTTLAQPAEELGEQLAGLFLEGLNDFSRILSHRVALPLRLVVRESCGAAPNRPAAQGRSE